MRIIRGIATGVLIWGVASVTAALLAGHFYPQRIDTYYLPGYGGFSPSSAAYDEGMGKIFLLTVTVYTITYVMVYLYKRHKYYKTHPSS